MMTVTSEVLGEKAVPVPLCPPYILRRDTWDRTQISAVAGQQITDSAMAHPLIFQTKGNKQADTATMHLFMQDCWFFVDC